MTTQPDPTLAPEAESMADLAPETPAGEEGQDSAALAQERDEWKDKAYRLAAEMENLKRRHAQELESARNFTLQSFGKDLLPVADNFSRALQAPQGNEQALREGVTMVAAAFQQVLERHGIRRIEVQPGQPLNPDLHQVMTQTPSEHPQNTIVAELQAGFTLNGRLLRAAFVSVSTGQSN